MTEMKHRTVSLKLDIEQEKRKQLISYLGDSYHCLEECRLGLMGFNEILRADVVAFSKCETEPWTLAFEVKVPTHKWELKHWLNALRQAGNYPNCTVIDERAGSAAGSLIDASFIYPGPDLGHWKDENSQDNRFYRDHDIEPLRGAILLAQHFKVGTANYDPRANKFSLKLGTDPIWDTRSGFRKKSKNLLAKRKIGSLKRSVRED